MVIKSKISMICLQPPEGKEFNFVYKLMSRISLLLEDSRVSVMPNNPNTRESNQVES